MLILEDNPYGDIRIKGESIPCIKSMDEDGIVIYAGTFSKVISPRYARWICHCAEGPPAKTGGMQAGVQMFIPLCGAKSSATSS